MKTWATGVDSLGSTRQITVGDIWECMADDRVRVEILSFNGQWFEVEMIDHSNGFANKLRIMDFNDFVNNWQIYSYATPPKLERDFSHVKVEIYYADTPSCECGAHKVGVKDYAKGHSTWCGVYRA